MINKWEQITNQWKQFSAEAKKKWSQLNDEELAEVEGSRRTLATVLQKRYIIAKKEAHKQIDAWRYKLNV
jgi:uncharacterized protein YjbJ (UPF0337 family)